MIQAQDVSPLNAVNGTSSELLERLSQQLKLLS